MLKSEAIAQSGADIEFWVDLDHEIGEAVIIAASFRPNSVICTATRYKQGGFLRRRAVVEVPRTVFTETPTPILAMRPRGGREPGAPDGRGRDGPRRLG